ncbi:MAG TPA: oligosaccharide flippase family protein [Solirubrobacterales bacterium]|nr:oligosaccharide flippase family protein [Solirubrobacterales bacterium]
MSHADFEHGEISKEDLKQAAVDGVRWTTFARVAIEIVTLGAAIALARLIPPAGFGEAVVPLIFVPLAVIFTFEGFGSALVQRKTIERSHTEAAMLASLVVGAALTALMIALARPLGEPLFGTATAHLLVMISPVFLLAGIGAVSRSLLWRRLDFRRVSLIEMASLAIGAVVSVALALGSGLDAPAIVLGALAGSLVTTVLLLISVPPPLPLWHRGSLREILAFGLPASGAGLTYVAITNATLAVAAIRLTATQVGLFWRAFQLGVIYQEKISGIMVRLAFPVYSRTNDLDELRGFHERATRIHAAVLLPLLALLAVTAPDLVPWLFGERWAPAVEPVQILCVAGMIAAILTGYPQIMLAAGKPRALFVFNLVLLALYIATSWFAAPYGITALAAAVVGVHVFLLFAVYGVLFRRVLGIPTRRLVTDLLPAVASSVLLLAAAFPAAELLRSLEVPVPVLLAAVGSVGALVYMGALRSLFPVVWADVAQLTRRVLPAPSNALAALRPRRTAERAIGGT